MTAYTLHSQGSYGLTTSGDGGTFTLGTQFAVAESIPLTGIWFFSGASAGELPSAVGIWNAGTETLVAGTENTSATWSGAAASGWVKYAYSGSVTLVSGTSYIAAVGLNSGPTNWFYDLSGYWTSGAGASGITNGPLSAPSSAAAVNGQAVYNGSNSMGFPASTVSGYDFGVDVEVTVSAAGTAPLPLVVSQAVKRAAFF